MRTRDLNQLSRDTPSDGVLRRVRPVWVPRLSSGCSPSLIKSVPQSVPQSFPVTSTMTRNTLLKFTLLGSRKITHAQKSTRYKCGSLESPFDTYFFLTDRPTRSPKSHLRPIFRPQLRLLLLNSVYWSFSIRPTFSPLMFSIISVPYSVPKSVQS